MRFDDLKYVYFIGIGGIGMSALARFFHASGKFVSGYDKTPSQVTNELQQEGVSVHFEDKVDLIDQQVKNDRTATLVVWTPAIPEDHHELNWFRSNGYKMMKRAQVLGLITENSNTIAVAGTHGKTTTTTLTAHLLRTGGVDCSAFLGGISGNYHTNLLLGKNLGKEDVPSDENIVVAEADEFDRSFLWLHPSVAIMTSVDADHLDIYQNPQAMYESYSQFASQVKKRIIAKNSVIEKLGLKNDRVVSYSLDTKGSYAFAENIRIVNGRYVFDVNCGGKKITDLELGLPGRHNVENAVAAVTAAKEVGVNDESVRKGLRSFKGVARRFDYRFRNDHVVYIDDYGHHPAELAACISSAKELFPGKRITGIFQPHLYSRTRDFADEFAQSLSLLDDVVLLEIYPAREKPIPGVTSSMLLGKISSKRKVLCSKTELVSEVMRHDFDVLLTMGAGDIDQFVLPFENALRNKFSGKEVRP